MRLRGPLLAVGLVALVVACGGIEAAQSSDASPDTGKRQPEGSAPTGESGAMSSEASTSPDGEADGGVGLPVCPGMGFKCGDPCPTVGLTCRWCPPRTSCNFCQNVPTVTCLAAEGGVDSSAEAGEAGAGVWGECIGCGV